MNLHRRSRLLLPLLAVVVVSIAATACRTPKRAAGNNADASPTGSAPGATAASATPSPYAGTVTALRTPESPADTTCKIFYNTVTKTAAELASLHGANSGCGPTTDKPGDRTYVLIAIGGSDPRLGFVVCTRPPDATAPYCGIGIGPALDRTTSYLKNWTFYPLPDGATKYVGDESGPGEYQCVGNDTQLWAFQFDTLTYTKGCVVPPFSANGGSTPCEVFQYRGGAETAPDLYHTWGKPAACQQFDTTIVGVTNGLPQPGVVVCGPASSTELIYNRCLGQGPPATPMPLASAWQFLPLPIPAGPVESATFDTTAGTACITAAGQAFIFTLATRSLAAGCGAATPTLSPAPAATGTPAP